MAFQGAKNFDSPVLGISNAIHPTRRHRVKSGLKTFCWCCLWVALLTGLLAAIW
jgi:hypothetical protein